MNENKQMTIQVITPGGFILKVDPDHLGMHVSPHKRPRQELAQHLANMTKCRVRVTESSMVTAEPR